MVRICNNFPLVIVRGAFLGNLLCFFIYVAVLFLFVFFPSANAENYTIFKFDISTGGKVIQNKFSDINVWNLNSSFGSHVAENQSDSYFAKNYPFVKRVQLMTATGGSEERDLFVNPSDRSTFVDYKFDNIIAACRNIIRFGLKPEIKTGNVPLKFSSNPKISRFFGVNVRPPDDYNRYYNYIKDLASALVNEFGLEEVKTWSWGVLTEYENKDWFQAEDGIPESTKIAYFKLYDYTVAALEDVIGAENLVIGAHSMTCLSGFWDEMEFIDHVAFGTNYKTGKIGTQIDYLAASFYDTKPGVAASESFDYYIDLLRDRAIKDGLLNLKFGIDEGRILKGADGKPLTTREVAMSYQGAANAKYFKVMIEKDVDWFSIWGINTEGLFGGIDVVGTHVANLGYKMVGEVYLIGKKSGIQNLQSNFLDAIGSVSFDSKTAHLMLYNYNSNPDSRVGERVLVKIDNVDLINPRKVLVKKWVVDDDSSNYWPTWWRDMAENGIDTSSFRWSQYSVNAGGQLNNKTDRALWYANLKKYSDLAELKFSIDYADVIDGGVELSTDLSHHAVVFYELTP